MTLRQQNIADLKTLIKEARERLTDTHIEAAVADLTDSEIGDLVDKQAHLNEWLDLA